MLRMEIEFDVEQIHKEAIVTEDMLYGRIAKVIDDVGLVNVSQGVYQDAGNDTDLTSFMGIISWLSYAEWFQRYVKRWDWYNDRCGAFLNIVPENLLENI